MIQRRVNDILTTILAALLTAWILDLFGGFELVQLGVLNLFNFELNIQGYYLAFVLLWLMLSMLKSVLSIVKK